MAAPKWIDQIFTRRPQPGHYENDMREIRFHLEHISVMLDRIHANQLRATPKWREVNPVGERR